MLWLALTLGVALATAGLTVLLVRLYDRRRAKAPTESVRTPRRRFLDGPALATVAAGLAVAMGLGAASVYWRMAHSPAATGLAALPPDHPGGDAAGAIEALEARMRQTPNDPEGWRMLGWSYLQVGKNADAAGAYGRAAALDPHNPEYRSAQGEATVLAADGQVTPAAEAAFKTALSLDPADPRARYYLAIARYQKGDKQGAMADWVALLKSAPPDAPWAAQVRAFVEKVAAADGVDLAARLPPAASGAQGAPQAGPGPTAEQMAAAGQMNAADRQAMIAGMVQRLSDRLAKNPRDLDGWQRLMRARMVLGQTAQAGQAYRDGLKAFSGSASEQAALRRSAADLGVPDI